jgi:hypothetical protein
MFHNPKGSVKSRLATSPLVLFCCAVELKFHKVRIFAVVGLPSRVVALLQRAKVYRHESWFLPNTDLRIGNALWSMTFPCLFYICVVCVIETAVVEHYEDIFNIFEVELRYCHVIFRAKEMQFPASATSRLALPGCARELKLVYSFHSLTRFTCYNTSPLV